MSVPLLLTAYRRNVSFTAAALTGSILVLAVLPPLVGSSLSQVLMSGFSFVCHQLPDRSPAIGGEQLAACHRCFGIYGGLFIAALGYPMLARWGSTMMRYAGPLIFASLLPAGIDWLGEVIGIWQNTPLSRVATGLIFGIVAGFFFARAVKEIVRHYRRGRITRLQQV